jgi:DNA-binding CsgD family transcriptional regulator/tetratricopeptide (TPR) repeat protein
MIVLEREPYLLQLHQFAQQASEGTGRLVFVGGEMGIGKTTLIEQFRRELDASNRMTVVSCDGLRVHGPLGPLMDVAHTLGPDVVQLLETQAPRDRIFRAVESALTGAPGLTVLVGEDVHWGDEASLDLLYFLGRRIGNLRTLFIATYRDDEIPAGHPLRRVLGDLATVPAVRRMTLPPLSLGAVAELATGTDLDPLLLHEYTEGNPFFVREIVESGTPHPITIQDAILARASRLPPETRAALDAAAVIGMTIDPDLLRTVAGGPVTEAVDECLAVGLFRPGERAIEFRHAAVREAIVQIISPIRKMALHRQIYASLQEDARFNHDSALLAYHAEEAANGTGAYTHALAAANQAMAYKSHREAAAQFARALRHCPRQPPERRIELLEQGAYECYLTSSIVEAVALQGEAVQMRRRLQNAQRLGSSVRVLSRYCWFSGETGRATELAREALDILGPFPESREMAMACSNFSQLRMLSQDVDEAVAWGNRAIALAVQHKDPGTLVHAMTNVGSAMALRGEREGVDILLRARHLAEAEKLEDDVSRALTNLAWTEMGHRNLEQARGYLEEGLAYTDAHDLLAMNLYMRSIEAQLRLATGDWDGASQMAGTIVAHPMASVGTRIGALVARGLSRIRRGEPAGNALDLALELATQTAELQRIGLVRAARAEAAWLVDDPGSSGAEAAAAIDLARERQNPWFTGELAVWLWRSGEALPPIADSEMAEPYRLELAGDWKAAAAFWHERGYFLEHGRALGSSTDEADLRTAWEVFDAAGARPDAGKVSQRMRTLGFRHIRRGPRPATRTAYAMLTPREVEVLALLAGGSTNREIAERLYVSRKTVEHHVSAILGKLDVPTRKEAATRARLAHRGPDRRGPECAAATGCRRGRSRSSPRPRRPTGRWDRIRRSDPRRCGRTRVEQRERSRRPP